MNNKKTKKVIVTGGAGFIGSHLTDALIKDGFDVVVLDNLSTGKRSQVNKMAKFIKADIRNLKQIKPYFKGANLVFHTAARARIQPSIKDPVTTFDHNVAGTLNVLLAARDAGVKRVIYCASSSSYGDQDTLPLHEEMNLHFKTPYALTKYVGEELCRLFSNLYGLETVSLRYFNVYGPRQILTGAYATVIGIFLKQAKEGKPLTIVGDGNIQRDFTHIYDVVRANMLAARSNKVGRGEVINIGTGQNYSINEVAAMILMPDAVQSMGGSEARTAAFENSQPEVILASALKNNRAEYIPPRPGETRKTLANNSKARDLLGWRPTISLEEGLAMLKAR
ncbi:MAG: NAD-dependent epimerase/dehydratase family protein [Candidatus Yanofskybacteria bacterium]|nr:NAD-dependent epimerase/dehydratase family protein [Candidatus Yanofskybacteria bacterium]